MGITELGIGAGSAAWRLPQTKTQRARAALVGFLESCGAFEWVALSYLGLSGFLIMLFWRNLPRAGRLISIHVGFIAAIIGLVAAARRAAFSAVADRSAGAKWVRALSAARNWYPQAVFLFCFEELGAIVHLVRSGWWDSWLLRFDHWIAGEHPAVLLARIARPWLTEIMQVGYLSYFFFLTILAFVLYTRGADDSSAKHSSPQFAFWAVMTSSMAAYSIGYVVSISFPVESPYYSLAALHLPALTGGPFTRLSDLIEHYGRVHGGAFPSEHVAGSFVALLGAWRYRRRLFWWFVPFFALMCFSTVYVRNHYIADVFGGLITGWAGFWLGHRLMRVRGAVPSEVKTSRGQFSGLVDAGGIQDSPARKGAR